MVLVGRIEMGGVNHLPEVVDVDRLRAVVPGAGQDRQQQRGEKADDGHDGQQLQKREREPPAGPGPRFVT